MRLPILAATVALLAAACGGGAAPSPSVTPSVPQPTPVMPTPSGAAAAGSTWLRASTFQAIPPVNQFAVVPSVVITADGAYVTPGPMPAIFPGQLVPALNARTITDAGREQVLALAEKLGLLSGATDFTGGNAVPGGLTGRILLTVDGGTVELTGNPGAGIQCVKAPCDAPAGSPEAFGQFWLAISDPTWLGSEVGPEQPFHPERYAILVGPAPESDPGLPQQPTIWPLSTPMGSFGGPVAGGTYRCGIVEGADAATLGPVLDASNQLTPWVESESTSATFGLTVRPIVGDEDPCRETFGPA